MLIAVSALNFFFKRPKAIDFDGFQLFFLQSLLEKAFKRYNTYKFIVQN